MYSVRLTGGATFRGLGLNGNNFVSRDPLSEEDFKVLPCAVEIECDGEDYEGLAGRHECMELVQVKEYSDGWYFILRDVEATEYDRLDAKVEYLAMMTGVEL